MKIEWKETDQGQFIRTFPNQITLANDYVKDENLEASMVPKTVYIDR